MTSGEEPVANVFRRRSDARQNQQRILAAADELYAERGLDVSLDQIATAAGVGVGTVYRNYATKRTLIRAVYTERFRRIAEETGSAAADPDPWNGLISLLESLCRRAAKDRGFAALLVDDDTEFADIRRIVEQAVLPIVERARLSGQLRADAGIGDLIGLVVMVIAVADFTRILDTTVWPRFFGIMLDGLRSETSQRPPLTTPPMSLEQFHAAQQVRNQSRRQ